MRRAAIVLFGLYLAGGLGSPAALAQTTTCKTSNCAVGKDAAGNPNLPVQCQNIASPRFITVEMTNPTAFVPQNPRIEGESATPGVPWNFQCIRWHKSDITPWHSSTEVTTGSGCNQADACTSTNITPPCDWETGNIDSPLEWSVCHYAAVAPAAYPFICRLHHNPPFDTMNGTLTVVSPIQLLLNKDANLNPVLQWTGGVGPWNVFRDTTPAMPVPTNLAPATTATSLTDTTSPDLAFYLVVEAN